jgi:hypothetical protein
MSGTEEGGKEWKHQIERKQIAKSFYIEAARSNFYPGGIVRLYRVTRNPSEPRPGDFTYQSVRIRNPEELSKVEPALALLASRLGWQQLPPLLKSLEDQLRNEERIDPDALRIVQQYPKASIGMLKAFDEVYKDKLDVEDFPIVLEFVRSALESIQGKQNIMLKVQLEMLNRLGKETSPEGMQRLLKLLEEYDLPQLTSVTGIITDRLRKLEFLEAQIQNENAYEIKGKNSIHNQLARSLWVIDDSYWLLHSNEPLTNFLKKKYEEGDSDERKRPDLICAVDKHDLVIVELKRPSHKVEMKDIDQLENYLITTDDYAQPPFGDKKGFLIANEISPHLQKSVDNRKNIEFISYLRLIENCKIRYQQYLDAINAKS